MCSFAKGNLSGSCLIFDYSCVRFTRLAFNPSFFPFSFPVEDFGMRDWQLAKIEFKFNEYFFSARFLDRHSEAWSSTQDLKVRTRQLDVRQVEHRILVQFFGNEALGPQPAQSLTVLRSQRGPQPTAILPKKLVESKPFQPTSLTCFTFVCSSHPFHFSFWTEKII